jgi:hypothetical protein
MTTTLAKVTGIALLAASFAFCGSLAYADMEDTTSIQILTFDAVGNPGEIIAALDCDTEDGMGSCPAATIVAADATATTVADAFDPAVLEVTADVAADTAEPAIRPVDAIIVTGEAAATAAIPAPDAETATVHETTGDSSPVPPNEEKLGKASAPVVVEVTRSLTVAMPGQAEDEPVVTSSITEPSSTAAVDPLAFQ